MREIRDPGVPAHRRMFGEGVAIMSRYGPSCLVFKYGGQCGMALVEGSLLHRTVGDSD